VIHSLFVWHTHPSLHRQSPSTRLARHSLIALIALTIAALSFAAYADNFKMSCDVQGTIAAMQDKELAPSRMTLEIESIGNNIFMHLIGAKPYEMKLSTLTTKVFVGTNLTNAKHLGVRTKNKETNQEGQLVIDQKTVGLSGYNDIEFLGKPVRLTLTGTCILPN
jgi:hypothetical protein